MQFDEEYWQLGRIWPGEWRAPVFKEDDLPATGLFRAFAKLSQEPSEVVASISSNVLVTQEPSEVVLASLSNVLVTQAPFEIIVTPTPVVDEFYWLNWVAPVQSRMYQRLPIGDPEEIPAGSLLVSPSVDEYYWQNPVRPIAASMYRSPVFLDPDEVPFPVLAWAKMTQAAVEIIVGYSYNPYVGWQGTSMSVS